MFDASPIFYLAMFTLSSALLVGFWEYANVSKSLELARVKRRG